MIEVTHRRGPIGWEFDSEHARIQGGGRTLDDSIANAEHAVRQELSRLAGRAVAPAVVQPQVNHVRVEAEDDQRHAPLLVA
jgi:hypothetical protein